MSGVRAGRTAQTMGEFVRRVPEWGLPPFAPGTQSLEVYEQGTLILDVSSAANDVLVWRASAAAQINRQATEAARNARISEAAREMLKPFPPKR
jgi:uncharacterized protein DUF4136